MLHNILQNSKEANVLQLSNTTPSFENESPILKRKSLKTQGPRLRTKTISMVDGCTFLLGFVWGIRKQKILWMTTTYNHNYSDTFNCNTRHTWECFWWLCTLLGHGEHRMFRNVKDPPANWRSSHSSVHFDVRRPTENAWKKIVKPGCACELLRPIAIFYSIGTISLFQH